MYEILLVDDIKDNLLALGSLLARDDIKIYEAQKGTDALELMMKHDFCLTILDIQMPGMNGFELAELMRGSKKTKSIPIIFVTAATKNEKYDFKGYESGAVDFLRKPLDPLAVKSKVNVFIELHRQKRDLELAIKVREEFMSIAGHELKTPLTSLRLQCQIRQRVLEKGDLSVFTPEKLKSMFYSDARQVARLTRLIDDMLDITRIASGKLSMNREEFDLGEVVLDIVSKKEELFTASEITVEILVDTPIVGHWDRIRIEQVLTNLLTNAMRYGAGKPVTIRLERIGKTVQLTLVDQGIGIAKENLQRIFERFERATTTEVTGLGLGLYIVSQIIEAHQGTISVTSVENEGSTFVVTLPL